MDSHLSDFVGKIVLFKVTDSFANDARVLLQSTNNTLLIYGKLISVDGIGCWIENSRWSTVDAKTNKKHIHKTNILIPWQSIISVATFPERQFDGVPNESDAKGIGFHADI